MTAMDFEEVVEGCVAYQTGFTGPLEASSFFERLRTEVPWRQENLRFKTNVVPLPRLVSWHGDPGANYYYSGIHNVPVPWTPTLLELKQRCDALNVTFNSVLLNYYRSGADSIGYHCDNERDLVEGSIIATLSLGGRRTFHLKPKDGSSKPKKIVLDPGSLLLMYGECQKLWLHGIPKEPDMNEPRISLTFRTVHISP